MSAVTEGIKATWEQEDPVYTGRETRYAYVGYEEATVPTGTMYVASTTVTEEGGADDRETVTYYYLDAGSLPTYVFKVKDPEGNETEYWR